VRVYLLLREGRSRPLFYSEDTEVSADDGELASSPAPTDGRSQRGWLERAARWAKSKLLRVGRRAGPRTRRALAWLNRRPAPDEPLLRGLRRAAVVELHHPSHLSAREARREWRHYLARRRRGSLVAAAWDGGMCLLALPLVLLPGPNVLGLWFVYRAIHHLLAIRGIWRVETRRIATEFHAQDVLNEQIDRRHGEAIERIAATLGLKSLSNFLRLSDRPRHQTPEEALPPEPDRVTPA
jgi:hypothetical protein